MCWCVEAPCARTTELRDPPQPKGGGGLSLVSGDLHEKVVAQAKLRQVTVNLLQVYSWEEVKMKESPLFIGQQLNGDNLSQGPDMTPLAQETRPKGLSSQWLRRLHFQNVGGSTGPVPSPLWAKQHKQTLAHLGGNIFSGVDLRFRPVWMQLAPFFSTAKQTPPFFQRSPALIFNVSSWHSAVILMSQKLLCPLWKGLIKEN